MEKNYIISKCDDSEFCFQPQGNSLIVLLDNDEKVCVLNETSKGFCMKIVLGKQ